MSSRDDILSAVRANLPKLDRPLPWVPMFDDSAPVSPVAAFKESLLAMGGDFLDVPPGEDPLQAIRQRLAKAKVVCSATPEVTGNRSLSRVRVPQVLADVRQDQLDAVGFRRHVEERGMLLLPAQPTLTNDHKPGNDFRDIGTEILIDHRESKIDSSGHPS